MSTTTKITEPSEKAQKFNRLCQDEPYSFIIHGFFWSLVLIVASPIIGVGYLLFDFWSQFLLSVGSGKKEASLVSSVYNLSETEEGETELCVYITGCDKGFGRLLSYELAKKKGYYVFAGCLTEDGMKQYESTYSFSIHDLYCETFVNALTEFFSSFSSLLSFKFRRIHD